MTGWRSQRVTDWEQMTLWEAPSEETETFHKEDQ